MTFPSVPALLVLISAALSMQAAPSPPTVAIFDFEAKEEAVKDSGSKVASLLTAHLTADPSLILVERAELEKALGEQELGLSGTVSNESAAKVGHLTGAKVLITGKVFKVDRELTLVAKIIGTETSRVYGELASGPAGGPLNGLAEQLARKLAATVNAKVDTLIAKVPTREERADAIKKELKEAKRPSVLIRIPEQHYGHAIADPAAETELGKILTQCGFTLVDERSDQKPDVEIIGEAFSAQAIRRGNLVSCKARVELKARTRVEGKILAVDRETSVAVDVAEQTAAKTALQNAAAELASRIAPRLLAAAKLASKD